MSKCALSAAGGRCGRRPRPRTTTGLVVVRGRGLRPRSDPRCSVSTKPTFGHGATTGWGQRISKFRGGSGPKPAGSGGRPEAAPGRFQRRRGVLARKLNGPPRRSEFLDRWGACWVLRPPGPGRQRCRCSLRQVRSCHSTAPPPHSLARPGGRGDARGACRRRRAATQASRAAGPASVARLERPCADSSGIPLTSNIFTRELSDGFRWLCRGFRQLPIPLQRFPIASDSLASVSDSFRQLCERSDSFGSEQVRDSRSTDRLQPSAALPLTAHGQQLAAGRLQGLQRTEGSATGSSEAAQPARKQNRGPAVGRTPVLLIKTP